MDENEEQLEQKEKEQSTRPDNWPGMPARSASTEEDQSSAKVTQAQRELEREVRK